MNPSPFTKTRSHQAIYWLLGIFSTFLFLKNVWVAEDAFIILRTVDQYLHGNGFRWNPHDRTQVYTSPLWFLLIIATTLFSKTLYLNLVGLSLAMHIGLLWVMARLMPDVWRWSAAVLLLTLSQAFFEFTGSGLEYPLAYFLLAASVLLYARNNHVQDRYWLALSTGLTLITRHDLLFLLLPMLAHLAYQYSRLLPWRQGLLTLIVFLLPLSLWTLFSLFYYGVPFPNTAYAKLSIPGLPLVDRVSRGFIYLTVSLKFDPITPAILALAIIKGLACKEIRHKMVALGVLLSFAYVTSIGADYMIGRFYSTLYLVAALLLALVPWEKPFLSRSVASLMGLYCSWLLLLILFVYLDPIQAMLGNMGLEPLNETSGITLCGVTAAVLFIAPWLPFAYARYFVAGIFTVMLFHTTLQNDSPWMSGGKDWGKTKEYEIYVAIDTTSRERYWIYRWTSLFAWFNRDPNIPFPNHDWCERGKPAGVVSVLWTVGMQGYCMPRNSIGFDYNGLVDPLMARMPKHPDVSWVPGGSVRIVPEGYIDSLKTNSNLITDPDLALYYDKLRLITQSNDLFAWERITSIIAFNAGAYEHWRRDYIERAIKNPPPTPPGL